MTDNMQHLNLRQEFDDLNDFINNGWLASCEFDGPTFLWHHLIRETSEQANADRQDMPVAAPHDAEMVIRLPMQWYFDSMASIVPTAVRTEDGVEMPRIDMPTFHMDSQALSGVDAVVGNALMSTRWEDAAANLATAIALTAKFVGNVADRDNEGFDYLKELIQNTRLYLDSVACHADPMTGEAALRTITQVACNEDFRLNPMQMVELLSCCLSFAQWDDTSMFAYDALNKALATMDALLTDPTFDGFADDADGNASAGSAASDNAQSGKAMSDAASADAVPAGSISTDGLSPDTAPQDASTIDISNEELAAMIGPMPDLPADLAEGLAASAMLEDPREVAESVRKQFEHSMQFLRHDLMRVSGDAAGADRFLFEHHTTEPLADAYAARLWATERWSDLLDFIDLVERDSPNQATLMFPEELVPYEWESLREAIYELQGRRDELCAIYRERLDDTFDVNTDRNRMLLEAWQQR